MNQATAVTDLVTNIIPAPDNDSICSSCGGDKDIGLACPYCFIPVSAFESNRAATTDFIDLDGESGLQ